MNTRKRLGWLELIEGILLLILGIITLFQPREALRSFVAVYGIIALLTGLVDIAFYIVMELRPDDLAGHGHSERAGRLCADRAPGDRAKSASDYLPDLVFDTLHLPADAPEHRASGRR